MKNFGATIKIRYGGIAVFLSLLIVISIVFAELLTPNDLHESRPANEPADEGIRLPVAMYHHILNSPSKLGDYVISPAQFEEDLMYIQKMGYTTISAKELIAYIEEDAPLPEKPIMITFDDGYESAHEYAFPLLQKYNMKAVISVIGKHTDIFSNENEPRHINYSHTSWEQLREMQESGVFEIGNHTYDMHSSKDSPRYGIRPKRGEDEEAYEKALMFDIGGLNEQITKEIGVEPIVFAYPFGALSDKSKPVLAKLGFKVILTCEEKVNVIKKDTEQTLPLRLKRFNRASKYSTYEFYKRLFE